MEADDSALCTLKKIFTNKILASVKSDIKEGKENLDKCIDTIVQNAAEVCFIMRRSSRGIIFSFLNIMYHQICNRKTEVAANFQ